MLNLDTSASRPSRVLGSSYSFASPHSAPLGPTSGLVVSDNAISHVTAQCAGAASSRSSSLAVLLLAGAELSFVGHGGRGAVFNNVIRDVVFSTPNGVSSSSPVCAVTFAVAHFSANVDILDNASLTISSNQVSAVYAAQNTTSTERLVTALDGCLLMIDGCTSVAGEKTGAELRIVSNNITDVNASRSIVAFASNASIAQRGVGVFICDNTVSFIDTLIRHSRVLSSPPSFVSIRGIIFNDSLGAARQQLTIAGNTVEMTTNNVSSTGTVFVFVETARCVIASSAIDSQCSIHIDNNVIQQNPSATHNSTSSVFEMSSVVNLTTVTFENNTISTANGTTIIVIGRAAINSLVVSGNNVSFTSSMGAVRGGGGDVRSLLRISGEMYWASGWKGVTITDNEIASVESSTPFPNPSGQSQVLFDNAGSVVQDSNVLEPIEIVLCRNVLFGFDQQRHVVEREMLLRYPHAFNTIRVILFCLTRSSSLSLTNSITITLTPSSTITSTGTVSPPLLSSSASSSISESKSESMIESQSYSPSTSLSWTTPAHLTATLDQSVTLSLTASGPPSISQLKTITDVTSSVIALNTPSRVITPTATTHTRIMNEKQNPSR